MLNSWSSLKKKNNKSVVKAPFFKRKKKCWLILNRLKKNYLIAKTFNLVCGEKLNFLQMMIIILINLFGVQHSRYKLSEESRDGTLRYCLLDVFLLRELKNDMNLSQFRPYRSTKFHSSFFFLFSCCRLMLQKGTAHPLRCHLCCKV